MFTQQALATAKRAREAQRRIFTDMERSGEQPLADRVIARIDDMKVKHLASGAQEPLDERRIISDMGGFAIEKDELYMYGVDPAVLYVLNDEESTEPQGEFYGFDDGSIIYVEQA